MSKIKKTKRDDKSIKTANLRYNIIAPLLSGNYNASSKSKYFLSVNENGVLTEDGYIWPSAHSVKHWYLMYLKEGYDGLLPKVRSDIGRNPKVDPVAEEHIKKLIKENKRITNNDIHKRLMNSGIISSKDFSLSTLARFIANNDLRGRNKEPKPGRQAFQFPHTNDCWQGDTTFGLYLKREDKASQRLCIIGFIDDCSRKVVCCMIFTNDNADSVMQTLKRGIQENGQPKAIFVDNGKSYINEQINLLCGRLGIDYLRARAYSPESKAKIERFWRTLKGQWMSQIKWEDMKSIGDLQKSLDTYILLYNHTPHSNIGTTPQARFLLDRQSINYLPLETLDKVFMFKATRLVMGDGTIRLNNRVFEIGSRLSGRRIEFSYRYEDPTIIYASINNVWYSFKQVNKEANSNRKRQYIPFTSPDDDNEGNGENNV